MKKKKILLIILPIILILVIGATLAILYFTTDMFKGSDVLFAKYFSQNGELLDIVKNPNAEEQKSFKANNTYTMTGDLTTTVQDGANSQEVKAVTATRHDANTGRTYSEITLKNGEADTLKVSYINSGDVYAIKCDDIMANYIGIRNSELKKFAQNMGVSEAETQNIPDSIDLNAINNITTITEEQKTHITETYSKVISESISTDKYAKLGKTQISVDGTSYEVNAYQVTLDDATLKQIIINCLTTLKDDNATLVLISNKLSSLGMTSDYTDITKLSEAVGQIIAQIQNTNTTNSNITITVYENKGKTIRTELTINTNSTEEIGEFSNTTGDNTIALSTNASNTGKITIDKLELQNTAKAIITIEESQTSTTQNGITGETNESTPKTSISQVILQKTATDESITNDVTVIPDTNNTAQSMTMSTTLGKLNNNTISNTSSASVNISSDGINVQTVQSSYTQNIQAATEIEEIMELKNSNTVIFNNYTSAQLTPFLTQVGEKIAQVIPDKMGQLGIDITSNQNNGANTNNLISVSNNLIKIIQIVGTSGVSIANANGVDTIGIGTTAIGGIGIYIYNQSSAIVADTQNTTSTVEQNTTMDNQTPTNTQELNNQNVAQ